MFVMKQYFCSKLQSGGASVLLRRRQRFDECDHLRRQVRHQVLAENIRMQVAQTVSKAIDSCLVLLHEHAALHRHCSDISLIVCDPCVGEARHQLWIMSVPSKLASLLQLLTGLWLDLSSGDSCRWTSGIVGTGCRCSCKVNEAELRRSAKWARRNLLVRGEKGRFL